MKDIYLSIIIPCFNEQKNLKLGALSKVGQYMKQKDYKWEVIVVDDGSGDQSKDIIKDFINKNENFKLIENKHQGKAATVMTGMLEAKGQVVLFTDLDQATPISQLDRLLPWIGKGFDIIIGSRNRQRKGAPILRLAMARGFMLVRNIILNLGINDTQCGFKLFTSRSIQPLFDRLQIYKKSRSTGLSTVTAGFDVEVLFIAKKLGFTIKEVPVDWLYQDTKNINPFKDSIAGLLDLIHIRLNSLKGLYG